MLKYCLEKWDKNKNILEEKLRTTKGLNECRYKDLVKMVVDYILNYNTEYELDVWSDDITEVDHGSYSGTLLYLIHKDEYAPYENDYLMTYVNYGSCSGCDTLKSIQSWDWDDDGLLNEGQIKAFMTLCKDLVTNIVCPYNIGWRSSPIYETVEVNDAG